MLFFYDATLLNNCATAIMSHYDRQSYFIFSISPILPVITPIVKPGFHQ